jgi:hypothetical protein
LKVKNKESTLNWAFEKEVLSDFFGRYCTRNNIIVPGLWFLGDYTDRQHWTDNLNDSRYRIAIRKRGRLTKG